MFNFEAISQEDYDNRKGWRSTSLKSLALKSISHALLPYKSTDAMDLGTLVHILVLEPHRMLEYYTLPQDADLRVTKFKKLKEEKEAEGLKVIKHEVFEAAKACSHNLMLTNDSEGNPIFLDQSEDREVKTDFAEPSLFWADKASGLELKCRPDYVRLTETGYIIVDIKTTSQDTLDKVARSVVDYAYHMQMVLQCEGFTELAGSPPEAYYYVFVETSAPYGTRVVKVDTKTSKIYALGERLLRKAISRAVEYESTEATYIYSSTIYDLDDLLSSHSYSKAEQYLYENLQPFESLPDVKKLFKFGVTP